MKLVAGGSSKAVSGAIQPCKEPLQDAPGAHHLQLLPSAVAISSCLAVLHSETISTALPPTSANCSQITKAGLF